MEYFDLIIEFIIMVLTASLKGYLTMTLVMGAFTISTSYKKLKEMSSFALVLFLLWQPISLLFYISSLIEHRK